MGGTKTYYSNTFGFRSKMVQISRKQKCTGSSQTMGAYILGLPITCVLAYTIARVYIHHVLCLKVDVTESHVNMNNLIDMFAETEKVSYTPFIHIRIQKSVHVFHVSFKDTEMDCSLFPTLFIRLTLFIIMHFNM